MRIAPPDVPDELDFFESMLVGMGMGTPGTIPQGLPSSGRCTDGWSYTLQQL